MKKQSIQNYINNFRRKVGASLRPGIGISVTVHQAQLGGAILVFELGKGSSNTDRYEAPKATVNAALSRIPQHAFKGALTGVKFIGTNTILEPGRVIFIKDDSEDQWSDAAATKDVAQIIRPLSGQPA